MVFIIQGTTRRTQIIERLKDATAPISATALSKEFSVSRQVIVGDVAILRAGGADIVATPRGYVIGGIQVGVTQKVACIHSAEETEKELTTIVQAGGEVIDVIVEHAVYGQLTGGLHIRTLQDVKDFMQKSSQQGGRLLSDLTDGIHLHTIRCGNIQAMEKVLSALSKEGFLYNMHTLAL